LFRHSCFVHALASDCHPKSRPITGPEFRERVILASSEVFHRPRPFGFVGMTSQGRAYKERTGAPELCPTSQSFSFLRSLSVLILAQHEVFFCCPSPFQLPVKGLPQADRHGSSAASIVLAWQSQDHPSAGGAGILLSIFRSNFILQRRLSEYCIHRVFHRLQNDIESVFSKNKDRNLHSKANKRGALGRLDQGDMRSG
jgi:hypothetical protein